MARRWSTVLLDALPPPWRRAVSGYLRRPVVVVDELPPEIRPHALSRLRTVAGLPAVGSELTVVSFNVKRGERSALAIDSLRRAVEDHRPELLLLQEAPPELFEHPRLEDVMANRSWFFAPFHQVERPDRRYPYRLYGQLIASTCRLDHTAVIELPTVNPSTLGAGHTLKRIALYAELPSSDGRTIGVVNVHNEPFARRRLRQVQHATFLQAVNARRPDVAICCGDFNPSLGQRAEPGLQLLEANGFDNAFCRRWRALDSCLARGHDAFTLAERLPLPGSDHRPIVAQLRLCSDSIHHS